MAKTKTKIPVSERALLARINRKLAHDGVRMHKFSDSRPRPAYCETMPRYYSTNERNHICGPDGDDLAAIGRDLGVLRGYETLAEVA